MNIFPVVLILFVVRFLAVLSDDTRLYTCDFDLVSTDGKGYSSPLTPEFLSTKCAAIYDKRFTDKHTYNMYLEEAKAFKEFLMAIESYEARKSGKELCANKEYALDIGERQFFYKQVNLCDCYKKNNQETFLKCLTEKRRELASLINNSDYY
ncbi:PREDICTED: uncharacterized protein LOC108969325 [Bactrocera latifrons]|uniref:Protein TsetseEP domain-containing protein n=1 Tax=Bactrocera latifrons TaxID=174628 RepID=A0A0K8U3N9_BACLA|nr:PREDICTED: uncharacterized protein LOC108969325 [Bactrocera latifrons]